MIKKIINKIKSRIEGEFDCPSYWWSKGYEDCDEGCHIDNRMDCYKCKYRFYPNFLIQRKVDLILKKEEEYWQKEGQKIIDMEALQTTHNSNYQTPRLKPLRPNPLKRTSYSRERCTKVCCLLKK